MSVIRVIDFETTGTAPPAEVCEVGLCDIVVEERHALPPHSWLCGVQAMPPEVRAIHHIPLADCVNRVPYRPEMLFGGGVLLAVAAHHSDFETQWFKAPVPVICTYKSALRMWPEAPTHSNQGLRYWLEDQGLVALDPVAAQPAHRAGPDAYVTAHTLLALFRAGATIGQLVQWTQEPRLLPTCPIGREWRGKKWDTIDGGFLGWMLRQPDMEADLKWNAQRELTRRAGGPRAP